MNLTLILIIVNYRMSITCTHTSLCVFNSDEEQGEKEKTSWQKSSRKDEQHIRLSPDDML